MAFFDDLNKRINSFAQSAQKATEIARLQHQITQKQAEFDTLYRQIGQLYYSCRQRSVLPDENINALCDRVTELTGEIAELEARIDDLRGIFRCPVCQSVIDSDAAFCSKCGARIERKEPVPEPAEEAPAKETKAAEDATEAAVESAVDEAIELASEEADAFAADPMAEAEAVTDAAVEAVEEASDETVNGPEY